MDMTVPPRRTLRSATDLAAAGLANPSDADAIDRAAATMPIAIPRALATAIHATGRDGPLARQFVPDRRELEAAPDERADPIGDATHSPVKGIVHRYPDRVLLMPHLLCPVYCRFCFRREQVGAGALTERETDAALDYIAGHDAIWEVILSGGDPLFLSPRRLAAIVRRLDAIPHVEVIRVHTRVPIADPARITPELVAALAGETPVYVVLHCNHAAELTEEVAAACRRIQGALVPMLSQSVLLKGVNDDPETLATLFRTLVRHRIKPYYLHHPDLARGTAHFRVTIEEGQALMRRLRGRISGLCLPTYMLDIPDGHGKVPAGPDYLAPSAGTGWSATDPWGRPHAYAERPSDG